MNFTYRSTDPSVLNISESGGVAGLHGELKSNWEGDKE